MKVKDILLKPWQRRQKIWKSENIDLNKNDICFQVRNMKIEKESIVYDIIQKKMSGKEELRTFIDNNHRIPHKTNNKNQITTGHIMIISYSNLKVENRNPQIIQDQSTCHIGDKWRSSKWKQSIYSEFAIERHQPLFLHMPET